MPWVEFTANFDYPIPPANRAWIAFKAGDRLLVTTAQADAAVAAGAAKRVPK